MGFTFDCLYLLIEHIFTMKTVLRANALDDNTGRVTDSWFGCRLHDVEMGDSGGRVCLGQSTEATVWILRNQLQVCCEKSSVF